MQERWMSVREIAAHLGVNRDTIYKWIERKKMPAHKVGRSGSFWIQGGSMGQRRKSGSIRSKWCIPVEEKRAQLWSTAAKRMKTRDPGTMSTRQLVQVRI